MSIETADQTRRTCPTCKGEGRDSHIGRDGETYEHKCCTCVGTGDIRMSAELTAIYDAGGFDDNEAWHCEECGIYELRDAAVDSWHNDDDGTRCPECEDKLFIQGAMAAGIPLSVIRRESKLSDHFSRAYINEQCGHSPRDLDEL